MQFRTHTMTSSLKQLDKKELDNKNSDHSSREFDSWFRKFSDEHSWYKHIAVQEMFIPKPNPDGTWTFVVAKYDDSAPEVCKKYSFPITPFVYPRSSTLMHALGKGGWPIFDMLDTLGYKEESKYIRALCSDNSHQNDPRYKINYHNTILERDDPIITGLYKKEYKRIRELARTAYEGASKELKNTKNLS